ncbi:MAG: GDSL-type esterase/lipase family protein [Candidatus Peribacteria bacterium]|jgi:hypothetical protein|nr:GDSL-type esterase/lipase family protein [Candidatus Peribacteria bacterium]
MYYKTPYKDGKIVVTIQLQATGLSSNYYTNISRSTNSKDYRAGIMINGDGAGYINIAIADDVGSANPISQTYEAFTASDITSPYITTEFIVESIDETSSRLTFTVYDGDLNAAIIKTTTYDDSTTELQTAGKWGIGGRDTSLDDIRGVAFDAVTLYTTSMPFAITVDKDIVQTSDTVTFTLFDEKESTITLTDDKGGVFTPTTVTLDAGNKYTATATYTPVIAGATVITATANDSTTLTQNITVLPYATTIGFVGDSINVNPMGIYAALAYMGAGFSIANAGQNGSATSSWANDYNNMMTNALTMFNNAGVDIVHIFLGANDANLYGGISGEDYKINMQTIIDTLKNNAPIKHVIISSPIYSTYGYTDNTKIQAYHSVIQELVAENSGFVLGGDRNAYEWFEQQETATPGSALIDKIHPRPQAYIQLGEFW